MYSCSLQELLRARSFFAYNKEVKIILGEQHWDDSEEKTNTLGPVAYMFMPLSPTLGYGSIVSFFYFFPLFHFLLLSQ